MSDAVVNGLAGATGGIIATFLTYPIMAANTRQHTERTLLADSSKGRDLEQGGGREGSERAIYKPRRKARWPASVESMIKVVESEGWGGLYRGLQPSLIGTACSQGVYYYFYQLFRDKMEGIVLRRKLRGKGNGSVGMGESLLVAALAGVANVLLTNPIWIIVTRMQTHSQVKALSSKTGSKDIPSSAARRRGGDEAEPFLLSAENKRGACRGETAPGEKKGQASNPSMLATVRELHREAGILGFWKGVFPTLVMVSNPAIQFAIYESLMARLTAKRPQARGGVKSASATEIFLLGAIAKLGATVITYPLLVVKSRLQAKQDIGQDASTRYSGTLDAILKMIRHEGLAGFYKGMSTKIVQSVFAAAVLFLTKEELVKLVRLALERRKALAEKLRLQAIA
eukprot:TRINITY_DN26492_c0_g1_i1.p1 TRINITY_DN26492_c0_g1~~TRINITY_DN26492_c0_g1_i1.p1  ORF type:complete len:399 (+),score=97.27 TRINITY_DN26492_c0_g1_i1:757-1953(+)